LQKVYKSAHSRNITINNTFVLQDSRVEAFRNRYVQIRTLGGRQPLGELVLELLLVLCGGSGAEVFRKGDQLRRWRQCGARRLGVDQSPGLTSSCGGGVPGRGGSAGRLMRRERGNGPGLSWRSAKAGL
jgi:hypothetical protein